MRSRADRLALFERDREDHHAAARPRTRPRPDRRGETACARSPSTTRAFLLDSSSPACRHVSRHRDDDRADRSLSVTSGPEPARLGRHAVRRATGTRWRLGSPPLAQAAPTPVPGAVRALRTGIGCVSVRRQALRSMNCVLSSSAAVGGSAVAQRVHADRSGTQHDGAADAHRWFGPTIARDLRAVDPGAATAAEVGEPRRRRRPRSSRAWLPRHVLLREDDVAFGSRGRSSRASTRTPAARRCRPDHGARRCHSHGGEPEATVGRIDGAVSHRVGGAVRHHRRSNTVDPTRNCAPDAARVADALGSPSRRRCRCPRSTTRRPPAPARRGHDGATRSSRRARAAQAGSRPMVSRAVDDDRSPDARVSVGRDDAQRERRRAWRGVGWQSPWAGSSVALSGRSGLVRPFDVLHALRACRAARSCRAP